MSAFRLYFRVVSQSLQPEEISKRLGAEPDDSTSIGSRRHPQSPRQSHTTWIRRAGVAGGPARPEDLEPVVVGWGLDFADVLGRLVYAPKKAVLSADAEAQFSKSFLVDGRWTKVGSGRNAVYYRYFDDGNGKWHWSGSTNGVTKTGIPVPIPMSRVPIQIKRG
ncbi:DUF4279 domain-containing protein [Streptomyces sp. NPDC056244]|uniref:DUF4279 domain-containing protein n=1 Tax=Streptomyces sp. NPDC056244 TaxID=3345762 RepID=UPI0035DE5540